ncbi:cation:proton antiporter [Halorhodospira halophila]|uniref:Transporter, CPA2 family n=1 Tax=Halorhodospira halophila (strain DSM 244 / SL1) TaxID=349124 RepID=A1WY65_HALHL|nr:cation:proton antiporter family protein [Halorhodospira halophila]ABM62627.1 transporter, CPA2 family [Halorhodospira halophila SL1]MBK1728307.1 sodium:proton exchanger [Halorhodospira halophila]
MADIPAVEGLFNQFAILLLVAAVIGFIGTRLKQPLIVSFIAVGILVGPSALGWVDGHEPMMDLLAEIGIALLLFIVGLKLDLHLIRTMGPVALATGLGQVLFTSAVGFLIALALGMEPITALYVAVALTFSSTIIIVKLLSDKKEIDALHGRIAIGFLIVQDICVVLAMILITSLAAGEGDANVAMEVGQVLLTGVAMLLFVALMMRYVLPPLLNMLARTPELLVLFSIALAVAMATGGDLMGFSKEVGAFLAGIAIASTPYREAVASRLTALRDFLLLFFFISLGAQLDMGTIGDQVVPALIFSTFVLIGNPIIVLIIMGYMGYRKRTGFLAGLTVAQISEFSLILAALGMSVGHIGQDTMGLVTLVGLITIGASTYMILYSKPLYERLAPLLSVFERKVPHAEIALDSQPDQHYEADVVIFGLGRYGHQLAKNFKARGWRVLGVDFDPTLVGQWREEGHMAHYGDASDPEFPQTLPLARARWVISTVPDRDIGATLISALRSAGYQGKVAVTSHSRMDADYLRGQGPDRILLPFVDAAEMAVAGITGGQERGGGGR